MSDTSPAVFLSYASQDAEAAQRICEALRAARIEVWFDQSELRGGDAWDAKIRKQIKECALFVPIISANTQARLEGYFRLEWKLAEDRSHLMAKGKPFIVPVCIDETKDWDAHVPDAFTVVQWTRLPGGETTADFCERVEKLLGDEGRDFSPRRPPFANDDNHGRLGEMSLLRRRGMNRWLVPSLAGLAAIVAFVLWQPWRKAPDTIRPTARSTAAAAAADPAAATELASIRARIVPDRWTREDFPVLKSRLDRIVQASPDEADAWALRSIIASLQVLRTFDYGTKVLMAGKSDAAHALRIAPGAPLGELALGLHFVAMTTRGGDPNAATPHIERAMARLPRDPLTRYVETANAAWALRHSEHDRLCQAWLKDDPTAPFPMWVLGTHRMYERRADEAEQWAERCARTGSDINGIRALVTLLETKLLVRGDPAGARTILDRVPAGSRTVHRVVLASWLLALFEQKWDEAIQELARLPDTVIYDRGYHGPKALLAGIAHQKAGRNAPAAAQFAEAERVLREMLREDADDEELRTALALTLAYAGRRTEARDELAGIEPLVRGRPAYLYSGYVQARIAETHAVLGDVEAALPWLRLIFAGPSAVPYTPRSFRRDPRLASLATDPRVEALLAEFNAREAAAAPTKALKKSIAVLAFENLSDDKANEYFSDGISEELLNVLAKVPGLKVCARTSSFHFKGRNVPVPEIAKQLGVAYVIEGSVRKAGSQVRVAARLINGVDGSQVWSDEFRDELKDVFALQDKIASAVAKKLPGAMAVPARVRRPVNPEAHGLVLEARHLWNQRTEAAMERAEELLRRAIDADPNFASAHAALADAWITQGHLVTSVGRLNQRAAPVVLRSFAAAERAIQLDPDLAEAHASLGLVQGMAWQSREALRSLRRAIELNPSYASAHQWLGRAQFRAGFVDEALRSLRLAVELDPLSFRIADNYSLALVNAGRPVEALVYAERALTLQPDSMLALSAKAASLLALNQNAEAIAVARRLVEVVNLGRLDPGFAAAVLAQAGSREEAERAFAGPADYRTASFRAAYLATVGRYDDSLAALDPQAIDIYTSEILHFGAMFDPMRNDPRFVRLLRELGLTEAHDRIQAWRAANPPQKAEAGK